MYFDDYGKPIIIVTTVNNFEEPFFNISIQCTWLKNGKAVDVGDNWPFTLSSGKSYSQKLNSSEENLDFDSGRCTIKSYRTLSRQKELDKVLNNVLQNLNNLTEQMKNMEEEK